MKKRLNDFEHFELDGETGTICNTKTGQYFPTKLPDDENEYIMVSLSEGRQHQKTVKLHRLMAEYFIPNPDNKPTVHHINHNRHDNRVSNLRWATYDEQRDKEWRSNQIASHNPHAIKVSKGLFEAEYPSVSEASRQLGISKPSLFRVLKGIGNTTKGYKVEYLK